jgi:hypothetical protein
LKKKKKRTLFPTPKKRRGFYEKNTNLEIRRRCCAMHAIPQLLLPSNPEILQRIDRSSDLGRVSRRAPQLALQTPWCNNDEKTQRTNSKGTNSERSRIFYRPGKGDIGRFRSSKTPIDNARKKDLRHDRKNLIRLDETTLSSTNTIIQEYKFPQYEKCTSNVLEPCL